MSSITLQANKLISIFEVWPLCFSLNEWQIEALRLMVNEGRELSNKEYREMFGVGTRTASRDLMHLVAAGLAQQVGRGRSVRYKGVMARLV